MITPASTLLTHDSPNRALLVIDVQNDFIPGGAWRCPVATRSCRWSTSSAASSSAWCWPRTGTRPGTPRSPRATWQESVRGHRTVIRAADTLARPLHSREPRRTVSPDLNIAHAQLIVRKGGNRQVDSYSAFTEADQTTPTGLAGNLRECGIDTLFLCGLALDFCVAWTALHARREGFATYVVLDACRAIDTAGSCAAAMAQMQAAGVQFIQARQLGGASRGALPDVVA